MLTYFHIRTVIFSLNEIVTKDQSKVIDLAYDCLSPDHKKVWDNAVERIFLNMHDEYSIQSSHIENAQYVIKKLDLESNSKLYSWQIAELDRLYNRHITKLSQVDLDENLKTKLKIKAEKELCNKYNNTVLNQTSILMKECLDQYLDKESIISYRTYINTKKAFFKLEVVELTHAIDSLLTMLENDTRECALAITNLLKNAKFVLLYVKANIKYENLGVANFGWAIQHIKRLSNIKIYITDKESGKRQFFSNGYRQDILDKLIYSIYSSIDDNTSFIDIQKKSIDYKLYYLVDYIDCILDCKLNIDPPKHLITDKSNPNYIALIILANVIESISRKISKENLDLFNKYYETLYNKYMKHTLTRASNISRSFNGMPNPNFYPKFIDGCMECIEIH